MDLSFLGGGEFEGTLWLDDDRPAGVRRQTRRLRAGDALQVSLAAGGGGAAVRLVAAAAD